MDQELRNGCCDQSGSLEPTVHRGRPHHNPITCRPPPTAPPLAIRPPTAPPTSPPATRRPARPPAHHLCHPSATAPPPPLIFPPVGGRQAASSGGGGGGGSYRPIRMANMTSFSPCGPSRQSQPSIPSNYPTAASYSTTNNN